MKRYILLLLTILLISITGCGTQSINITSTDVTSIKFNDLTIIENDYNKITDIINNLKFKQTDNTITANYTLKITNEDNLYNFKINTDNTIYFKRDNKNYYAKDDSVKELLDYLNSLKDKYTNSNFYSIESTTSYETKDNDLLIKLDSNNEYLIFKSEEQISDFKINSIEYKDNSFIDVDLLYEKDTINKNTNIVIRKLTPELTPNIRISFTTPYNYVVTIIPQWNGKDGTINFIKTFKPKENS